MDAKKRYMRVGLSAIPVFEYGVTDSTNTRARELAAEISTDAAVIAGGQTSGRGRLGRSFDSSEGAGLYMSLLIHPKSTADALRLTALMGVAVCRAIESLTPLSPKIKWINDIQLENKKLAGILAEGEFDGGGRLKYAVIGVGLNILRRDFGELSDIATSLEEHTAPPTAATLFKKIIREFYRIYKKRTHEGELEYYKAHCSLLGENITVLCGGESYTARARDIGEDFSLIIEKEGLSVALTSAEVTVRRKPPVG